MLTVLVLFVLFGWSLLCLICGAINAINKDYHEYMDNVGRMFFGMWFFACCTAFFGYLTVVCFIIVMNE